MKEDYLHRLSVILLGRLDLVNTPLTGPCIRQSVLENA